MNVEPVSASERLRIAVLGDFDGIHTRSWLRWFVARGHDVHAISYYPPASPLHGVTLHALKGRATGALSPGALSPTARIPRGLIRLAHGLRYRRAGLKRVLDEIEPDVFHAHFVVEHGFYGALASVHPFVVTAWGSDILVEPNRDPVTKQIAKWTLRRADLVTSNNQHMAARIRALGVKPSKVEVVTLGADAYFSEQCDQSVNMRGRSNDDGPVILSTRAHEPLYNINEIIDAYSIVLERIPNTRLIVAHSGALSDQLQAQAAKLAGNVVFTGTVNGERLRELMTDAEVFVSVPSSDGTSVALLQAMSAGAFPVVSDLESQHEWIEHGRTGMLTPLGAPVALGEALIAALHNGDLRRTAAGVNRQAVHDRGTNETQMARMETLYRRLVAR
jgi:glycosyltransferase involved in cell wall biosynthesis